MSTLYSTIISAQINTPPENLEEQAQSQECENLIIGTWVGQGNSINYRDVYHSNRTMTDYTEGEVTKTYYWNISTHLTQSGITISKLLMQNTQNTEDEWTYEITALNDDKMVLLYNNGLSFNENIFIKQ